MKTKLFFTYLLLIVWAGAAIVVYANVTTTHPLPAGELLQALAFPNGDALTVSRQDAGAAFLVLGYYDLDGNELEVTDLPLSGDPQTLIIQACGSYAQFFIGYSDATAERFVYTLPGAHGQEGCTYHVYLPLIEK